MIKEVSPKDFVWVRFLRGTLFLLLSTQKAELWKGSRAETGPKFLEVSGYVDLKELVAVLTSSCCDDTFLLY